MWLKKVMRLCGVGAILSMLMMAIPAVPVFALSYDIALENADGDEVDTGAIGEEITIIGAEWGWSEDYDRYVSIYFSDEDASTNDIIGDDIENYELITSMHEVDEGDDEDDPGEFEYTFEVPDELTDGEDDVDVEPGEYYIYFTVTNSTASEESFIIRKAVDFEVIGGDIELDPEKGPVGTLVEITGESFPGKENIEVEFDGNEIDIEDGDDETDSDGDFELVILIPESTAGDQSIKVTVDKSEVEVDFEVTPEVTVAPQSGEAGTEVSVSGTGFGRRQDVEVRFGEQGVAVATTGSDGSFAATFTVPSISPNIYDITAEDDEGNDGSAKFTLNESTQPTAPPETEEPEPEPTDTPSTTTLTVTPQTGSIQSIVSVVGLGFSPNTKITVKYGNTVVAAPTSNDQGVFSAAFNIPASKSGANTVTASDGTNTGSITFTVESQAPTIPQPLKPEMGVKLKSGEAFDWEEVTDESLPVTYELQIATDEDFENVVMEIAVEDASEYILTEADEEELSSSNPDGDAYYWRIRSVDGAQNASPWTGAGEFYVSGSGGSFPDWAKYTLIGIGGVLLFGIGYWLGRRTAFFY